MRCRFEELEITLISLKLQEICIEGNIRLMDPLECNVFHMKSFPIDR